jgi:hypothetical protein
MKIKNKVRKQLTLGTLLMLFVAFMGGTGLWARSRDMEEIEQIQQFPLEIDQNKNLRIELQPVYTEIPKVGDEFEVMIKIMNAHIDLEALDFGVVFSGRDLELINIELGNLATESASIAIDQNRRMLVSPRIEEMLRQSNEDKMSAWKSFDISVFNNPMISEEIVGEDFMKLRFKRLSNNQAVVQFKNEVTVIYKGNAITVARDGDDISLAMMESSCEADCDGQNCGQDECGNSCGICNFRYVCNLDGQCVADCGPGLEFCEDEINSGSNSESKLYEVMDRARKYSIDPDDLEVADLDNSGEVNDSDVSLYLQNIWKNKYEK